MTYNTDPARTHTIQYTPRQWTRLLLDESVPMTEHLIFYVIPQLQLSEHYPADRIAASATPREASLIAAVLKDYQERGY